MEVIRCVILNAITARSSTRRIALTNALRPSSREALEAMTSPTSDARSHECLACGGQPDYTLDPRSGGETRGVCEACWSDRHDGLEERLLDEHILTPRVVTELQANFYDLTDPRDECPMTTSLMAFLEEGAQTTTLRVGSTSDLAAHVGVELSGPQFYGGVQWPGVDDPIESLYAAAVYLPLEAAVPLYAGIFVAARDVEQFHSKLERAARDLAAAGADEGGV